MQASRYSSLLPELFRHKTTKIRIFQPKYILIDFHGTISERKWEDKIIFPYVKKVMNNFLIEKINEQEIQNCIPGLKNESFEQRFRYKYDDAPLIDDQTNNNDNNNIDNYDYPTNQIANQMSDFLLWQLNMRKETKETQIIQRLIWQDGFKRRKILTPLYDDVFKCIKRWHDNNNCKIFIISSIEIETLELLFTNTDKGNLHQYISGYVSPKRVGDKMLPETYKSLYDKFLSSQLEKQSSISCDSSSPNGNDSPVSGPKEESLNNRNKTVNKQTSNNNNNSKTTLKPSSPAASSRSSLGSQSSEILGKPMLFLTDSGQEAKAASQVADGQAYECILVNRPGNKRIRTYYLSQFPYVDKFEDIDFV